MKDNIKEEVKNRLKRLEGQIRGLQEMVEKERYCIDILQQSSATKKALSSVEDLILENHLSTHVIEQIEEDNESKAIEEILEVYKTSKEK
ncbi:MAG: metal-sensitive transcriptional regulator [Candidatus Magasanikbacteria bacterium]